MTNCVKRLLPLALAAALAGCTMQATDSNATRYQVALVAKSKDSEFWNAVFTGAEAAATEYNMQLTIAAPNSEEDYEEQDRMIEKAVEDGAQAIVFSAIDYEKNAAAIDAAAARERVVAVALATGANRASMLQDVEAGRRTEIDAITGVFLDMARRHGADAPTHRAVFTLVKRLEG